MTESPAPCCPRCHSPLKEITGHDQQVGRCPSCAADFEFIPFAAPTPSLVRAERAVAAGDAVCYFHPENRAELACEGCGRLICPVCAIQEGSRRLCPVCVALESRRSKAASLMNRVLYDNVALALALFPLIVFPFTLVTAPAALGAVAWGWRKPGSATRSRHWRFVVATLVALAQIAAWVMMFRDLYRINHRSPSHVIYRRLPPS